MLIRTPSVLDSEGGREAAKRDGQTLNSKLQEVMEELRMRDKELTTTTEDSRRNEGKAMEKLKNLENLLENANQVK